MKKTFLLTANLLFALLLQAKVVLPDLISDNMVLQRESKVTLWGEANPETKIIVTTSWNGKTTTVKSDRNGEWRAEVETPSAGGPYSITFDDGEVTSVENVLIGEVWLCSGQSNMVMTMNGFKGQPVEGATEYIVSAKPSTPIRICNIKRQPVNKAVESCEGVWMEHTPENVANNSATAYFFAKRLQDILDVPIGVIVSAWGGSIIESWMPRNLMEKYAAEIDLTVLDQEGIPETPNKKPCYLYNGMLHPLQNYDIKGVIWYQGCTNRGSHERYAKIQPEFVAMLRDLFDAPELPFYYVQIAPFKYDGADQMSAALIREAQADGLRTIPNCGMVVSMDCGDEFCIHPAKKKPIGDRLAYLALEKTYGLKGIESSAPIYESMEIKGDKAIVKFKVGDKGIGPKGHKLEGFEIAGEDRIFYKAEAHTGVSGDVVEVSSPNVSNPVAVRYAFRNCSPISVYNTYGIPASPFRTDNWEDK